MLQSWRILFLSFLMITSTAQADIFLGSPDESGKPNLPVVSLPVYSTTDIKRMSEDKLAKTNAEMTEAIANLNDLKTRAYGFDFDAEKIRFLARFQTQESAKALIDVFRNEMDRGRKNEIDMSFEVLTEVLETLSQIATANPPHFLQECVEMTEEASRRFTWSSDKVRQFLKVAEPAIQNISNRREHLIDLRYRMRELSEESQGPSGARERTEEWLKRFIIGQPEIIQAFMDLEWEAALRGGKRETPDSAYLTGASGTGMSTAVETFSDALHGYPNAHLKHVFRMPVATDETYLWNVLGAVTGHENSNEIPPLLDFLVKHSGGKYRFQEKIVGKEKMQIIVQNPDYRGETLDGFFEPSKGILFFDRFHTWSKALKDIFVAEALSEGRFKLNNSNGGVAELIVPIRMIFASNEGATLVTSREANGQRQGNPLTYERSLKKWETVSPQKDVIKSEIMAQNGNRNDAPDKDAPGTSEQFLSLIPDRYLLLTRPLSPGSLQQIAEIKLRKLAFDIDQSPLLSRVKMTWDEDVPEALQNYDYIPENNGRPVVNRLQSLILEPLLDAVRSESLTSNGGDKIHLSLELNADKTRTLVIRQTGRGEPKEIRQNIRSTEKDRPKRAMTDEEIDEVAKVEEHMNANVFNVDQITAKLRDTVLNIANDADSDANRSAQVIMINGLSSTGKTETAEQLSKFLNKADGELKTIDFSNVQTFEDMNEKVMGTRDSKNNPIASDLMKAYDRANGRLVIALDELANVKNPAILMSLYDLFRKPVVDTFSDNKPRPMGGVIFIITGNVGQEPYQAVPTSPPMSIQMMAWADIAKRLNADLAEQRRISETVYSPALLNRIDSRNIYYIAPHTYKSLRQLAQLKLGQALTRIAVTDGRRGARVVFPSTAEYASLIDVIIDEGFELKGQGASIEKFVSDQFERPLNSLLLRNKIPSGASVVIKLREKTPNDRSDITGLVKYDLYVDGREGPLEFNIERPYVKPPRSRDLANDMLTAYHEAGHSVVREALFGDLFKPTEVSVRPGLSVISGKWTYYAGIARAERRKEYYPDRNFYVRELAVSLAGETAERIVTRGGGGSAGKQNDIGRVASDVRDLILRNGLAEKWGLMSVPDDQSVESYVLGLSEQKRRILERETENLISEARELAEQALRANFDGSFVPLAVRLAEDGVLNQDQLAEFYANHPTINPQSLSKAKRFGNRVSGILTRILPTPKGPVEIDPALPKPKKMADLDELAISEKLAQFAEVPLPKDIPLGKNLAFRQAAGEAKQLLLTAPLKAIAQKKSDCESDLTTGT